MTRTRRRPRLPVAADDARIHRRTLTKGVAWTAPVVAVSVAAPAFAASDGCLTAAWSEAVFNGATGGWSFCLTFSNCGVADIEVTSIETHTTYHGNAWNNASAQLVDSFSTSIWVRTTHTATSPRSECTLQQVFDTVPTADGASLLPYYYIDYPDYDDYRIDCVSGPVYPSSPLYPDSCKRLREDDTYLVVNYTMEGRGLSLNLPMNDEVGCRVTEGCES